MNYATITRNDDGRHLAPMHTMDENGEALVSWSGWPNPMTPEQAERAVRWIFEYARDPLPAFTVTYHDYS